MQKIALFAVVLMLAGVHSVHAEAERVADRAIAPMMGSKSAGNVAAALPGQQCDMKGESSVNVNFNSTEKDITKIASIMDKNIADVKALVVQAGANDIEVQSMNYSVNVNNSGTPSCADGAADRAFQFYGSVSFKVLPVEKSAEVLAKLAEKGFNAGLNANLYRQCAN